MIKKNKRVIIGIFIVLILLLAPLAFMAVRDAMYLDFFDSPFNDKDFNAKVWKQYHNSDDPDNPRGQMFDDLKKHYLKADMSKDDVRNLLGEPDFNETQTVLDYNLGMWSGFRIDYDSIVIEFDETGKLIKTYRVQH